MAKYEDEDDEMEEEFIPEEEESFSDGVIASTPWWGISIGLHVLAGIIMALIYISDDVKPDDEVVRMRPITVEEPEPPKDEPPELEFAKQTLDVEKVVEQPIEIQAEESDHNESDNNEEFAQRKSDSMEAVSDKPFEGQGTYDTIGGGGGGGGSFGGRLGGKRNLVARGGGNKDTENAVLRALKWLSRHQEGDGHWGITSYTSKCGSVSSRSGSCSPNPGDPHHDVGVSSLSLLAFLGAGYYHGSKEEFDGIVFGDVVKKGLKYLMSKQDAEGCIGDRRGEYMYDHMIATLALCEAYGLTQSDLFKDAAQKAVDFTIAAQNSGSGWRYSYQSGDSDSSVTGWAAMVLKSAEISGLHIDKNSYAGAKSWFDSATLSDGYYAVGYAAPIKGKVSIRGMNESFDHHESMTAIAIMSRIFIDKNRNDPKIKGGVNLLTSDLPKWETNAIDFYYWYYASLALFQFDGPSGSKWKSWNGAMKDALVDNQNVDKTTDKDGSWEPVGRWCPKGGRVYATAVNALTLEVYYRYASVFGGR